MNLAAVTPLLLALGQWAMGFALKRWPLFPNKVIPVATYLLGLLGFTVMPATAHAASVADTLGPSANVFLLALIQNLFVTGAHSTWKNTFLPALAAIFRFGKP